MSRPDLSVVVPMFNEQDNAAPLVREIVAALRGRVAFEIVVVDDHSRDGTLAALRGLQSEVPELRVLHHRSQSGQSTAVRNGVKAAHAAWIATLDGDGAYRKFKRPFRAVCWVGGGRASPVLGTDRTSVSGISASRGHAAALSAAMLR